MEIFLIAFLWDASFCSSFFICKTFSCRLQQCHKLLARNGDILDVDFYNHDNADDNPSKRKNDPQFSSLLEASLAMTPPDLLTTVQFVDPETKASIPCLMSFTVQVPESGETFVIGTPLHTQLSVYSETSPQFFLDPDREENLELMEMAVAKFMELNEIDEGKVKFWKTPRALTMEGDIDDILGDWKIKNKPLEAVSSDPLVDREDDDAFLNDFFRRELGENYEDEFLVDDEEIDRKVAEMVHLFNIPGLGTEKTDEGFHSLAKEIIDDANRLENGTINVENDSFKETALRLVIFTGPDGKPYSLVKFLHPIILVAREDEGLLPDQRMLLTKEAAETMIPQLEAQFEKQLKDAGFSIGMNFK